MQLIRYLSSAGTVALGLFAQSQLSGYVAGVSLHELLQLRADAFRARLESALQAGASDQPAMARLLAPIDGDTEVWAAGVTYKRSEEARREESGTPDIYSHVYSATRPELFFKANARRVAGPDQPIAIRADSTWDVPEPELVLVINAHGEIVGYLIGNDVSSRSIEGENPLYLPQAKVYAGSCALGPGITPAWEISDPYDLTMRLIIERAGKNIWEGHTSTGELKRRFSELVDHLFREDDFPGGVLLCTGTALVPDNPFTLQAADIVRISIDSLGTLSNPVVVGKAALAASRT
ncbi:MAG TPA: fumarylacetoacetate hydrolase family protein [Ktedonobacteraceae bacterium]|nr:fumarylacetoacetate hydrolase family protein [Ktedonobacteraceae bacterium]